MSIRKYASAVLERNSVLSNGKTIGKTASTYSWNGKDYPIEEGKLIVSVRAISARVNRNYDGFPGYELEKAAHTFIGRPVFVNHNNSDHMRTRGKILGSVYKESGKNNKDKYIELLIQVNAKVFPKLASKIVSGEIDAVSMGTDCQYTKCSVCDNVAYSWADFCDHIPKEKGKRLARLDNGEETLVYESCHGLNFFEISFVFDPADETAILTNVLTAAVKKTANNNITDREYETHIHPMAEENWLSDKGLLMGEIKYTDEQWDEIDEWARILRNGYETGEYSPSWRFGSIKKNAYGETVAPAQVDTLRQEEPCPQCGQLVDDRLCPMCGYEKPMGGLGDPDTSVAQDVDLRQENGDQEVEVAPDGDIDPNQDTDLGNGENAPGSVDKSQLGNRLPNFESKDQGSEDQTNNANEDEEESKLPNQPDDKKKKISAAYRKVQLSKLIKSAEDREPTQPDNPEEPTGPEEPKSDFDWDGEEDNKTASLEDLVLTTYKVGARFIGEVIDEDGVLITSWFKNAKEAQSFTEEFARDVVKLAVSHRLFALKNAGYDYSIQCTCGKFNSQRRFPTEEKALAFGNSKHPVG